MWHWFAILNHALLLVPCAYSPASALYLFARRRPVPIRPQVPCTYSPAGGLLCFPKDTAAIVPAPGALYLFALRCPVPIRPQVPCTYSPAVGVHCYPEDTAAIVPAISALYLFARRCPVTIRPPQEACFVSLRTRPPLSLLLVPCTYSPAGALYLFARRRKRALFP